MNSPPNNRGFDDYISDESMIDRLDAEFDKFRDDALHKPGMNELRQILSEEEFHALEQFVVYSIYDIVDFDGKSHQSNTSANLLKTQSSLALIFVGC